MPYRMVVETERVTKTSAGLKAKYESAKQKQLSHADLINAQVEDFEQVQLNVLQDTNEIRKGLRRLSEIALRVDPLSHVDYIDTLIRSEQQAAKPGWQVRMQQLNAIRQQAEHLQSVSRDGYDPFKDYKVGVQPASGHAQTMLDGLKQNALNFLGLAS